MFPLRPSLADSAPGRAPGGRWPAFALLAATLGLALEAVPVETALAALAEGAPGEDPARDRLLVVRLDEGVTETVAAATERRVEGKLDSDPPPRTVIFRLEASATGGSAEGWGQLAGFVYGKLRGRGIRTVAWLPDVRKPLGPGVILPVACHDVVLGPDARLAAWGPARPVRPLPETFEDQLERYARSNKRPTLVVQALAAAEHEAVLRVVYARHPDTRNLEGPWVDGDRITTFQTQKDYNTQPRLVRNQEKEKETVADIGEWIDADATTAKRFRLADHVVEDDIHAVLEALRLESLPDSGVEFLDRGALAPRSRVGQAIIDFFHHPVVRFLLILGGCLGFLLELQMLGTLVPAIVGMACFLVLFVSSLFPVTGTAVPTATIFEVVIFFVGLGLVVTEVLVVPGVAIFAVVGGAICAVSLVMVMVPPSSPPGLEAPMTVQRAIAILVFGFGTGALAFLALLRLLPRTALGRRGGGLISHAAIESVATADTVTAARKHDASLVGQRGTTDTVLRPAGKVLLDDDRLVDVVAEEGYIERGERVVVVSTSGPRTTVTRVSEEGPETGEGPGPSTDPEGQTSSDGETATL